jgi:hypothetical protein
LRKASCNSGTAGCIPLSGCFLMISICSTPPRVLENET